MTRQTKCKICNSQNVKVVNTHSDLRISTEAALVELKCQDCNINFLDFKASMNYYEKGPVWDEFNFKYQKEKIEVIRKYCFTSFKNKKILDIGCARGAFLKAIKNEGGLATGVELDFYNSDYCIKSGLKVLNQDVQNIDWGKEKFDIITLWHVIEHVNNLNELMDSIKHITKKDGYLIILTPNFDSWQKNIFGKYWFHYDIPRHLNFFSPGILKNFLKEHGFQTKKEKYNFHYDDSAVGLLNSILIYISAKLLNSSKNLAYKNVRHSKKVAIIHKIILSIIKVLYYPFFIITSFFKKEATVLLIAKRF